MARFAKSTFLVCALLFCSYAEAENVVVIKGNTEFEELVAKSEFVVAEFFAPWCGHCKKLAPEYEKAATQLKEDGVDIVLASVDATQEENKALAERFDVKGYPTLKIYRNHDLKGEEYKGPREADGIVSFLKKQSGPASKPLASKEDVDALLATDAAVIGLFAAESGAEYEAFKLAAAGLRDDLSFGHTTDASILADQEMSAPSVVLFKTYDEPKVVYSGEWVGVSLMEFLNKKSLPLVTELDSSPKNRDALRKLFASSLPKTLLFAKYTDESSESLKEAFKATALTNEGLIHFVQADSAANEGAVKFFGLTEEQIPAIVVHDTEKDLKFVEANIKADAIAQWVEDFKADKVEAFVKSEDIPEPNDDPVKVVVGKTFKEMVENTDKDVFIEFYAPWCGHCKKLTPIWEEVAEHFKSNDKLTIAKMDATANDVASSMFNVKGFPTLYFKKAGASEAIAYNGDRSKADLINFVNKHASAMPLKEEL